MRDQGPSESTRPRLFVGSSGESRDIAYAIQQNLDSTMEVTVWDQGIFHPTNSALESLLGALSEHEFGAFVFTPEDLILSRDKKSRVVRDNVVFELGLCLGRLGRKRSFIVAPRTDKHFHVPSDLLGVTHLPYGANRRDGNWVAALGPACNQIRTAVKKVHPAVARSSGASGFLARINAYAGITTSSPYALAIDVLPQDAKLKVAVQTFLDAKGWEMGIKEISMRGVKGRAGAATLVGKLRRRRGELAALGATEIHLFIAGPVAAGALACLVLDNWIPVKLYQKSLAPPPEIYEYFAPLIKA